LDRGIVFLAAPVAGVRLGSVLFGSVLFGVLVRQAGVVAAIIVLVLLSGLANAKFRIGPYLLLAVGLAAFCVLVFVKALGLPMPMVGPWLGF